VPAGDEADGSEAEHGEAAGTEAGTVAGTVAGTGARTGARIGSGLAREWARWRPLRPFLVATLAPVPFLVLAGALGGIFSLIALLWMTAVLHVLDEVLKRQGVAAPEPRPAAMADRLSVVLAGLHFGLLAFAVWALSGAAGLGPFSWLATFLAFGLWFGQVSNSNAHELIHRTDARLFRLGMWVYVSMLYGHHTSAHRLVHHRFVATTDDPSTAAEGEGFWRFVARAWPGAFVAGYEMEEHRRARRHAGGLRGMNPYTVYVAGGAGFIALMLALFGFDGLLAYLLLCGHAQVQMLLADYVQHYGLLRRNLPSGALEPAGAQHSWDAPHPLSGLMMLNAPRHADHHAHPGRRWPELRLSPEGRAPLLPWSLPVMATIALVPPLWRRVMDPRLAKRRRAA
jgi:alkane 1-monooxygenase